jgi:hypothetical protein
MDHTRKMILVPSESVQTSKPMMAKQAPYFTSDANEDKENRKIDKNIDKIRRLLHIVLRLAEIKGYYLDGRINNLRGEPIKDSDIVALINNALSQGKVLVGESDFIQLLHKAGVDADLIINENVKNKLINLKTNNISPSNNNEIVVTSSKMPEPIETENYKTIERVPKRDHSNIENIEETSNKRRKVNWVIPKSSYPKMTFRRVSDNKDKVEKNKRKWTEPDEFDQWRNVSDNNEESDKESVDLNEEIQEIPPTDYDKSKFILAPSKLD